MCWHILLHCKTFTSRFNFSTFYSSEFLSFYSIEKYITTSAYKAELDDEMSFEIGVLVTVIEKNFDGWWLVR